MVQAVGRRPLTSEARVRAWVSPCVICGGQRGTGTGFSLTSSAFPSQYLSTVALRTPTSPGGLTIGLLVAAVQRHSPTPRTCST
jgi:hypothetical protein